MTVKYLQPDHWIKYDPYVVAIDLANAKAMVMSLQTVPFQKQWVEDLQKVELKREVAGTSRIEGAEFTDKELEKVIRHETPEDLLTRSEKQAAAALKAYAAVRKVPADYQIDAPLIKGIHRLIVQGADDDHCRPGALREGDYNVTFGTPPHRGVDAGGECKRVFDELIAAIRDEFPKHDPLIQAIALHYHIAAMHPFEDGNGRTARAMEALMLGRAGLRDTTFIAMSNYYYEQKATYLQTLSDVRTGQNDLTPFLRFALKGVELQAKRLLSSIQLEIKKELYVNLIKVLFDRRESPRKRVIAERQVKALEFLLEQGPVSLTEFVRRNGRQYDDLQNPMKAMVRDVFGLEELGAITMARKGNPDLTMISVNLDWPQQITETEFFQRAKSLPTATMNLLNK